MSEQQTQNARPQDTSLNPGGYSDPRAAFSPKVKEFKDAMGLLYIRNNASGRNKFRLKWPEVAKFIFGEELIKMDNEGTQDRELRAKLENEAGLRRIALKTVLEEYENKSVKSGSLEFEYIGRILDKLGAEIGKLLYAEEIIERVRPALLPKALKDSIDLAQAAHDKQKQSDDALRARSAESALEGETFEIQLTHAEIAEKALADQERMALRPTLPDNPLAGLHEEMLQSSQFTSMKIEISDEIRPIETQTLEPTATEMAVSLPQNLDSLSLETAPQILKPEIVEETISTTQISVESYLAATQQNVKDALHTSAVQPETAPISIASIPALPPLETEKKPRLHIAGLRIKDEQNEDTPADQAEQLQAENTTQE